MISFTILVQSSEACDRKMVFGDVLLVNMPSLVLTNSFVSV